jgi:hypothetical protein
MVTRTALRLPVLAALLAALLTSHRASAEEPPAPEAKRSPAVLPVPRVHHAPLSAARARANLEITVTIEHPEVVRYAGVVFRNAKGTIRAAPLLRGSSDSYVATLPAEEVVAPGVAYTIEIERIDGRRFAAFASRDDMQPVVVMEDRADTRERALYKRLGGRRSVVTATGEFVRFGRTTGPRPIPCASGQPDCAPGELRRPTVDDQYWRVEAGYTYRPMRAVAEFGLRLGVVRGTSLVDLQKLDASKYKVGLNYGAPSIRFRLADAWHWEFELLTSITEIGFSVGGGTWLMIGDPYGTKLTLDAEGIGISKTTYFGSRFFTKLDILIRDWLILAPSIEVTDMPHAEAFGVRLLGDATFAIWRGLSLGLRGGYQARKSTSGGPAAGGTLGLAF